MAKPRVAVLGLGIMGGGMASRLLAEGFPLTAFNRSPEKTRKFADAGAFVANSIAWFTTPFSVMRNAGCAFRNEIIPR